MSTHIYLVDAFGEQAVAAVAALVAAYVMFALIPRKYFGLRASFWNPLRRALLPPLDAYLEQYGGHAEHVISEDEYVGTFNGELASLENALFEAGFRRYPLASLAHTKDGRTEIASWARHRRRWSLKQVHVRIFDSHPDVGESNQAAFDVYAHMEYNAHNPLVAHKHYRSVGISPADGIATASAVLTEADIPMDVEGDDRPFVEPMRQENGDL